MRNLERQIGGVTRKIAARIATAQSKGVEEPGRSRRERGGIPAVPRSAPLQAGHPFRTSRPGVATGVAWTETGGDVLYIEASLLPGGKGNIILTGSWGT